MAYNGPFAGGATATGPGNVPGSTAANIGQVLTVDAGGNAVWQATSSTPISSLPILSVEDGATDYLRILDASDATEKKILINDLMSA